MEEYTIKVGDTMTFYDTEGKNISQETVEEIYRQYGKVHIKCKPHPFDHRMGGVMIDP